MEHIYRHVGIGHIVAIMDKIKADNLKEIIDELCQNQSKSELIVDEIIVAINQYYAALDQRQNGDSAQNKAFEKIQSILGIYWVPGASFKAQKSPD